MMLHIVNDWSCMVSSQLARLTVLQFVLLSLPLLSLTFWFCAGSLGTDDGASRDDATQGEICLCACHE